jgi:sialic acid synthase SpsE
MAMALPLMALAAGARVIEKHITLDRRLKGRDYFSALNPDEFARLVTLVREADMALGRSDD